MSSNHNAFVPKRARPFKTAFARDITAYATMQKDGHDENDSKSRAANKVGVGLLLRTHPCKAMPRLHWRRLKQIHAAPMRPPCSCWTGEPKNNRSVTRMRLNGTGIGRAKARPPWVAAPRRGEVIVPGCYRLISWHSGSFRSRCVLLQVCNHARVTDQTMGAPSGEVDGCVQYEVLSLLVCLDRVPSMHNKNGTVLHSHGQRGSCRYGADNVVMNESLDLAMFCWDGMGRGAIMAPSTPPW